MAFILESAVLVLDLLCYQQMSHVPLLLLCFQEAGNDCRMRQLHLLAAFNSVGSRREVNSTQLFNRLQVCQQPPSRLHKQKS